jgi:hypothetical protein
MRIHVDMDPDPNTDISKTDLFHANILLSKLLPTTFCCYKRKQKFVFMENRTFKRKIDINRHGLRLLLYSNIHQFPFPLFFSYQLPL